MATSGIRTAAVRISILATAGALLAGCSSSGTVSAGAASGGHGGLDNPAPTRGGVSSAPGGSGGGSGSTGGATDSATPGSSDSSTDSGSGGGLHDAAPPKTGDQLKAVFPGNANLPPGIKRDETSALDSGTQNLNDGVDPMMPQDTCNELSSTGIKLMLMDLRASEASLDLEKDAGTTATMYIASFEPGDAVKQIGLIKDYMKRCPSYTTNDIFEGNVTVNVTMTPIAGWGDEAYELKMAAVNPKAMGMDIYLTRVGDVIAGVDAIYQNNAPVIPIHDVAKYLADHAKTV